MATSRTTADSASATREGDHLPTRLATLLPEGAPGQLRTIGHGTTVGGRRARRGAARRASGRPPRPAAEPVSSSSVTDRSRNRRAETRTRDSRLADGLVVVTDRGVE